MEWPCLPQREKEGNSLPLPNKGSVEDTMNEVEQQAALTKAIRRLIPFLFFLYVIAYLDRVNVGFAQLQMKQDLGFSKTAYGFGASIFFIGYFLFEVPSNVILQKVGARRWIARIMFTWGIVAIGMMFIHSALSFYMMRFLLGIAEAGFFPGVLYYLTTWFTSAERARIVAWFMTANAVAFIFGGPISGALLQMRGIGGLAGWQWLFLLEGLPAIVFAGVTLLYLPDGPAQARWLTDAQREWLLERLRIDQASKGPRQHLTLGAALRSPAVWRLCLLLYTLVTGMYGLSLWMPQLIQEFHGLSEFKVGLCTAVPYICAAISMTLVAAHSDRTKERRLHVAIPALFGASGLILTALTPHQPVLGLMAMSLAAAGMWATLGPFWSLPTAFLSGAAAAGGLALINAVGNLGGFVGPYAVGGLQDYFHNPKIGLYALAGSMTAGALLAFFLPNPPKEQPSVFPEPMYHEAEIPR